MDLDLRGGLVKKGARLSFRFSQHCYSRGPSVGEAIPAGWHIPEGPGDNPRDRIFCEQRYAYSLLLVQHLALIQNNGPVQRSRHLNFFATTFVLADESGEPVSVPYYIFLKAKKKQDPNQPARLDIFVESAYTDDPNIPGPFGTGAPIPFSVLLGQIWAAG